MSHGYYAGHAVDPWMIAAFIIGGRGRIRDTHVVYTSPGIGFRRLNRFRA